MLLFDYLMYDGLDLYTNNSDRKKKKQFGFYCLFQRSNQELFIKYNI